MAGKHQPGGFEFKATGNGTVFIHHHGRLAVTLKGKAAARFLLFSATADAEALQHRMARLTGHYKH
ncbi:MAG: hypothetical protein O3B72_01945 [Proteobacteria bacterium]|nr:hypothetical protein [Pseudomonadota bacterium]